MRWRCVCEGAANDGDHVKNDGEEWYKPLAIVGGSRTLSPHRLSTSVVPSVTQKPINLHTIQNPEPRQLNGMDTVNIRYLPETVREKMVRNLLGRTKRTVDFELVAKDLKHRDKVLEVAARETKKPRNCLKKKAPWET